MKVLSDLFDLGDQKDFPQIYSEWATCQKCEDLVKQRASNKHYVVVGDGYVTADVFIVTSWPRITDSKTGLPLESAAGKLIKSTVHEFIPEYDIFWTPVIGCRIVGHNRRYSIRVDNKYLDACRPRIKDLIEFIDPKLILLIGLASARSILGEDGKGLIGHYIKQDHSYLGRNLLVIPDPENVKSLKEQHTFSDKQVKQAELEVRQCLTDARRLYKQLKDPK